MKFRKSIIAIAALGALAVTAPAIAHHSFPATYHVDQKQTITGTVAAFLFRNPHSFVHVMAPDKDGNMQRWAIEWSAGAALSSQGVSAATLKVGDKVIVTGNPARSAADHRIRMNKIERPKDGWKWEGNVE